MRILVICDSTSINGFGHLSRCINLVRSIGMLRDVHCFFQGNYSEAAQLAIFKYRFTLSMPDLSILNSYDLVIVDSYSLNKSEIAAYINLTRNVVFIDDFNLFDYDAALAVINYRFNAEFMYKYKSNYQFLGSKFCIVKPELNAVRNRKLVGLAAEMRKISLFISGIQGVQTIEADIIREIDKTLTGLEISVLNSTASYPSQRNKIAGVGFVQNIEEIFDTTDLFICGGGGIKYESSYCMIPTLVYSITDEQQQDTNILSSLGIISDARKVDFSWSQLPEIYSNSDLKQKMVQSYETDSTIALAKELLAILN